MADRLVIFDYPSAASVALVHSTLRRIWRSTPYRVLSRATVQQALEESRFRVRSVHRQYVLPMWLHRAIGSRRFTARIESLFDRLGVLRMFGTPVTVCAERAS